MDNVKIFFTKSGFYIIAEEVMDRTTSVISWRLPGIIMQSGPNATIVQLIKYSDTIEIPKPDDIVAFDYNPNKAISGLYKAFQTQVRSKLSGIQLATPDDVQKSLLNKR